MEYSNHWSSHGALVHISIIEYDLIIKYRSKVIGGCTRLINEEEWITEHKSKIYLGSHTLVTKSRDDH